MKPLEAQNAAITAALTILLPDEADALIGEAGDEYRALIQGAEAVPQLQGQMMLLQLVHDAYALGVRRGRGEGEEEEGEKDDTI